MEIFAVSDFLKSGTHGLQECFHPWDSPSRPFLQPHQLLLVRGDLSAFTYVLSNWKHVVFDWVKVSDLAMREQYFCCHWGKKKQSPPSCINIPLEVILRIPVKCCQMQFQNLELKIVVLYRGKSVWFFFLKKVSLFQIQTCKICQVKEGNDGDNF